MERVVCPCPTTDLHTHTDGELHFAWVDSVAWLLGGPTAQGHRLAASDLEQAKVPTANHLDAQGSISPNPSQAFAIPRCRSEIIRRRVAEDKGSGKRLVAVGLEKRQRRRLLLLGDPWDWKGNTWLVNTRFVHWIHPISLIERCRAAGDGQPGALNQGIWPASLSVIITARRAISHCAGPGAGFCLGAVVALSWVCLRETESIREGSNG